MSTNAVSLTSSNKASNKGDEDDDDDQIQIREYYHNHIKCNISSSSISEIEEEEEEEDEDEEGSASLVPNEIKELFGIKQYNLPMPSIKEEHDQYSTTSSGADQAIYVGVGKSESSMEALMWALKHAAVTAASSTMLYLIHVFPEINYIPSPLGKLPKSQVSSQQVETYMAQERGKRRELLHTFLDKCSAAKVKVDTVLIESDMVGRAMLDLIPILNIKRLVLGTTKSKLRKLMSRKGNGITDQILQSAPEGCEINIICEGKQVMLDQTIASPSPRSIHHESTNSIPLQGQQQRNEGFSCICFKAKYSDI